jgi:micrococcal nuclease
MKNFLVFLGLLVAYCLGAILLKDGGRVLDSSQDDYIEDGLYNVTKVVDGDTIVVSKVGENEKTEYKVRLIGVDTPEIVDPRKTVQCFAKEASDYSKKQLFGRQIYLQRDKTQDDVDKYGRWLRYVIFPDGTDYNLQLIADGYAYEYTYDKPYIHQTEFKKAQSQAKENLRGLWSPDSCNGQR